jgi:hypothetical protein
MAMKPAAPRPGPLRLAAALFLFGLAGLGPGPLLAAAQATGVPETDVAAFLLAVRQAWGSGDALQLLPLFAPDAAVELNYPDPGGPLVYRGGGAAPMPLREGVARLLDAAAQPDLASPQTAPVVFGGAPATTVRWAYHRSSRVPGVPPEIGLDEVVLQGGQILAYTRTPDGPNEAARVAALARTTAALSATAAGAADGAGAGGARGRPSAQEGGTPAIGPWVLAAALSLLAVVALAALTRPSEGQ